MSAKIKVAVSPFYGGQDWTCDLTGITFKRSATHLSTYSIPVTSNLKNIRKAVRMNVLLLLDGKIEEEVKEIEKQETKEVEVQEVKEVEKVEVEEVEVQEIEEAPKKPTPKRSNHSKAKASANKKPNTKDDK
jgi:hypothetical protein